MPTQGIFPTTASCGPEHVRQIVVIDEGGLETRPYENHIRQIETRSGESEMIKNGMRPVHPGEILREDYLKPFEMSINVLATKLQVPASRINDIALEHRGIDAGTALCLARFFGGDAQYWLNLQSMYDLRSAE